MKILSTKEVADRIGVSERRIRAILKKPGIPGAVKVGRDWAIPETAVGEPPLELERPSSGRKAQS